MPFDGDPSTWNCEEPTFRRVFLSDRNDELFCIVDADDYDWLQSFSWSLHKRGDWQPTYYARRTVWPRGTPYYLHVDLLRHISVPPSLEHVVGDHLNGNTLDNRRCNLRWATLVENRRNRHRFWYNKTPETVWRLL